MQGSRHIYSTDFCESMGDGDTLTLLRGHARAGKSTLITTLVSLTKDREARNGRPRVGKLTIPTVLVYDGWKVHALINGKIFLFYSQIEPFLLNKILVSFP